MEPFRLSWRRPPSEAYPSVNSFTLPDTLTAVLFANSGACVTGASGLGHTDRAEERHRRRVASRCCPSPKPRPAHKLLIPVPPRRPPPARPRESRLAPVARCVQADGDPANHILAWRADGNGPGKAVDELRHYGAPP
jgi:hypothetical protein